MPLNDLGYAKRNIKRAQLLCDHIEVHMCQVYEKYTDDHAEFAEHVFNAGVFAQELHKYLEQVHAELCNM